jgi:hypothetical protein
VDLRNFPIGKICTEIKNDVFARTAYTDAERSPITGFCETTLGEDMQDLGGVDGDGSAGTTAGLAVVSGAGNIACGVCELGAASRERRGSTVALL